MDSDWSESGAVIVIDEIDDDLLNGGDIVEVIDLSDDDEPVTFDLGFDPVHLPEGHFEIDHYPWNRRNTGIYQILKPGVTVQLHDKSFLRIVHLLESPDAEIFLQGVLMKRTSDMEADTWRNGNGVLEAVHSIFPDSRNELCALIQPAAPINHTCIDSGLVIRPLSDVKRIREVIITNIFPKGHAIYGGYTESTESKDGRLYCRWKYTVGIKKTSHGMRARSWRIEHMQPGECDKGESASNCRQFQTYLHWSIQGQIQYDESGNSGIVTNTSQDVIDLTVDATIISQGFNLRAKQKSSKSHKYTSADLLSGAGGSALGQYQAGLYPTYAVDSDEVACLTLEKNLPMCQVFHNDITKWLNIEGVEVKIFQISIDVLHISFVCKAFSRANPGTNLEGDQKNVDLVYALYEILKKIRPRIVTLEQVDGILDHSKQAGHHLFAQFQTLLSLGYQFRCDVLNMADYGVAQSRKRLIVIASCPGQELPPWPKPTHGHAPGLQKPVTVRDVLAQVPRRERNSLMKHFIARPAGVPFDPRMEQARTITCSGQGAHPTENRSFTLRELAMLQGFPPDYEFEGSIGQIRTQIGNAVPPPFAWVLFTAIRETLEKTDAEFEA